MVAAASGADPRIPPGGSVRADGVIVDASGNPMVDPATGRPMVAAALGADPRIPPGGSVGADGTILGANGKPMVDPATGKPMIARAAGGADPRIPPGGSVGADGTILGANGKPMVDPATGKPMIARASAGAGGANTNDKAIQTDESGTEGGKSRRRGAMGRLSSSRGGGDGGDYGADGSGGRPGGMQRQSTRGNLRSLQKDAEDEGESDADPTGVTEVDALLKNPRQRRSKLMVPSLKGAKVMPSWMVHKATGTLMQGRIEYERELAGRGEDAEGEEADEQVTYSRVQQCVEARLLVLTTRTHAHTCRRQPRASAQIDDPTADAGRLCCMHRAYASCTHSTQKSPHSHMPQLRSLVRPCCAAVHHSLVRHAGLWRVHRGPIRGVVWSEESGD